MKTERKESAFHIPDLRCKESRAGISIQCDPLSIDNSWEVRVIGKFRPSTDPRELVSGKCA